MENLNVKRSDSFFFKNQYIWTFIFLFDPISLIIIFSYYLIFQYSSIRTLQEVTFSITRNHIYFSKNINVSIPNSILIDTKSFFPQRTPIIFIQTP